MTAINTLFTAQSVDDPLDSLEPMLSLARSMRAHLNVLVLGNSPPLPSPVYMETTAVNWNVVYREAADKANQRSDAIRQLAADADVSVSLSVEVPVSSLVSERVTQHALCSDLSIVPHGSNHRSGFHKQIFGGLLFDAAQPLLMLGARNQPITSIRRVMIAWSPVPQAARAVRYSLPFIADAESVHLALVNAEADGDTARTGEKMASYLERHGLSVSIDHLSGSDEVANILNRHADKMDADLIVMGGYGHSKLREWMLGGTTRFMLMNTLRPILMAH